MKTIVDFPDKGVLAEEAAEWLIRLDADTPPSKQELRALGEWLHRSPAHREELEHLVALWGRMNVLTELAVPLGKPRSTGRSKREGVGGLVRTFWLRRTAVAVLLLSVFGLATTYLLRTPAIDMQTAANGFHATAVGQQSRTDLPDGSQIVLNTNSQIRVEYGERYRQVHLLQGEAIFTVAKDAKRPFRVYAGGGRIQAIGTAFSVYLVGEDVQVTVTEGRVALASLELPRPQAGEPPAIANTRHVGAGPGETIGDEWAESLGTLSAGQVATIRPPVEETSEADTASLATVRPIPPQELAERLAWQEGVLMFSGDSLEDVVKEVSRYTTVSIDIPDPVIRQMRIGGRFPVGETEVMLAALETNFNVRVTRLGPNRVILTAAEH
jgi:transmembrane sensor